MLIPQEREKHLLFLVENKSRSLSRPGARSSGAQSARGIGMTPSGAIFHQPVKLRQSIIFRLNVRAHET
jgi:hypothetical protein